MFYFADDDWDECMDVVPDLCGQDLESDFSEHGSSMENFADGEDCELGDCEVEDYVVVSGGLCYASKGFLTWPGPLLGAFS